MPRISDREETIKQINEHPNFDKGYGADFFTIRKVAVYEAKSWAKEYGIITQDPQLFEDFYQINNRVSLYYLGVDQNGQKHVYHRQLNFPVPTLLDKYPRAVPTYEKLNNEQEKAFFEKFGWSSNTQEVEQAESSESTPPCRM
jgi:hypothetical protein